MKKRFLALACALLISGAAVFGVGVYLKYRVLMPLGLAQEQSAVALPFMLAADHALRNAIQLALEETDPTVPTTEATQPETVQPTTVPTAPPETVPPTTAPTIPPETVPPTTAPTIPPETVPPTTAPTTPPETVPPTTKPPETSPQLDTSWKSSGISVDESWYDDVLFIGNSRTCGLRDYGRKGNADYFCTVGMNVFNYDDQKTSDIGFTNQSLDSLLASKTYGKVFIGLGINECGWPVSSIMKAYKNLVSLVREAQPDAVIILEGIMTVGVKKASSASCFEPANLFAINEKIKALADDQTIFYIDVNELFANDQGYLPAGLSADGCHPYAKYYTLWAQWISYAVARLGL